MKFLTLPVPERSLTPGSLAPHTRRTPRWRSRLAGYLVAGLGFAAAGTATGEAVKVSWRANPEPDIAGYEIRYGSRPGSYSDTVKVGRAVRSATIDGLDAGTRYFFSLVAVNTAGLRSVPSEEAAHTTGGKANRAPNGWIASPSTGGTVYAGDSVSFIANAVDPDGGDKVKVRWDFGSGSGIADSTKLETGPVRFDHPGTFAVTLHVSDGTGLSDPTPAKRIIQVLPREVSLIPRSGWEVRFVDSEEADGYGAARSFDGDPSTFWHTKFRTANYTPPPHELQIRLDSTRNIGGFRYLPRQDSLNIGNITSYRFYVSMDGNNWGAPVAAGSFDGSRGEQEVRFPAKQGRYIRLIALGDAGGSVHSNVAEFNLLAAAAANRAPVARGSSVSIRKNKPARVTLKGSDPDGNPLHYRIVGKPKHGTLQGIAPQLTYRPKRGFTGVDKIRYRVSDGSAASKIVTVKIRVGPKKKAKNKEGGGKKKSALAGGGKSTPHPRISVVRLDGAKYRVLTIRKADLPAGRRPVVQVSSDLLHWSRGPRHTTVLRDDKDVLKVRDNTPLAPGRKRHIRLKLVSR